MMRLVKPGYSWVCLVLGTLRWPQPCSAVGKIEAQRMEGAWSFTQEVPVWREMKQSRKGVAEEARHKGGQSRALRGDQAWGSHSS
jgi:hypothetical protein